MKKKNFFSTKIFIFTVIAVVLAILVIAVGVQLFSDGFGGLVEKGSVIYTVLTIMYLAACIILIGAMAFTYVGRFKEINVLKSQNTIDINSVQIRKAEKSEINDIMSFYDEVIDVLENDVNYPLWQRNVHPSKEFVEKNIKDGTFFVGTIDNKIISAVSINDEAEDTFEKGKWYGKLNCGEFLVIHTLAVHPTIKRSGVAKKIVSYAVELAKQKGKKAIRLDVTLTNEPAMRLYEGLGFTSCGVVDSDGKINGIKAFQLYELVVTDAEIMPN